MKGWECRQDEWPGMLDPADPVLESHPGFLLRDADIRINTPRKEDNRQRPAAHSVQNVRTCVTRKFHPHSPCGWPHESLYSGTLSRRQQPADLRWFTKQPAVSERQCIYSSARKPAVLGCQDPARQATLSQIPRVVHAFQSSCGRRKRAGSGSGTPALPLPPGKSSATGLASEKPWAGAGGRGRWPSFPPYPFPVCPPRVPGAKGEERG